MWGPNPIELVSLYEEEETPGMGTKKRSSEGTARR